VLPTSEKESVATVLQAMQQAEAAQQQLMTTGPLAEAAAGGNALMADILSTHSMLQQLYHQSVRRYLETYQQLAVSPAGEHVHKLAAPPLCFHEAPRFVTAAK
jgi:hypothetical protein